MSAEKVVGIYCIENKINKLKYIGKSVEVNKRWCKHVSKLRQNKHENRYLQNSWNKYGDENFRFYLIEPCDRNDLSKKEVYYIKKLKTKRPNGYNLTDGGDGRLGDKASKKTKKKISESNKLRFSNPKNHPMYGRKHSLETKQKMSVSHKNISLKTRRKMSISAKGNSSHSGHHLSEKTKQTLREKVFGRKNKDATSLFRGVCYDSFNSKWMASVWNNKREFIGRYDDEISAAKAYDKRCFEIYGDLSKLNFPKGRRA